MIYLEKFVLLNEDEEFRIAAERRAENGGYLENGYPCMLFTKMELSEIDFEPVTILYGGNGSGKSTLLNIIALKLDLKRFAPYNSSELMQSYVDECRYALDWESCSNGSLPENCRIITSDDVFEYMLAVRSGNDEIREDTEAGKADYARLKYGENIKFTGMEDYEDFRLQVMSRKKLVTRRSFLHRHVGVETKLCSNGETALKFFDMHIQNDTLCCLDEPENSLSPRMQLELLDILSSKSRYCGCQFVIATHSPFLLSMEGAKIYDLDTVPVDIKKWWELENTRIFFDFFNKHRSLFE